MGSKYQHDGSGQECRGGGRFRQHDGCNRGSGRGRDDRGRGRSDERRRSANNVKITDPHRNFISDKQWKERPAWIDAINCLAISRWRPWWSPKG